MPDLSLAQCQFRMPSGWKISRSKYRSSGIPTTRFTTPPISGMASLFGSKSSPGSST